MASHLKSISLLTHGIAVQRHVEMTIERRGLITAIGPELATPKGAEVLDARGAPCLPGFANSRNHSPKMVVRGTVEDRGFAPANIPGVL